MEQGLTLINLKFFCDTAQRLSVSEAARMNFVTQSAISQGIRRLEKGLQVTLTNHSRHNLQLTHEGEIVLEKGRKIVRSFKEIQDALQGQSKTISGRVHIACTSSIGMNFMNQAMRAMHQEYPEVAIELKIGNPDAIRQWIKSSAVDFGLALASTEFESFEQTVLRRGNFCVFSSGPSLHRGVFVDERHGLFVELLTAQYRQKYKKELCLLSELGGWEIVAQFTQEGLGCGFFPDYLINRYPDLVVSQEKIKPIPYELVAVTNKAEVLSKASQAFCSLFSVLKPCVATHLAL